MSNRERLDNPGDRPRQLAALCMLALALSVGIPATGLPSAVEQQAAPWLPERALIAYSLRVDGDTEVVAATEADERYGAWAPRP